MAPQAVASIAAWSGHTWEDDFFGGPPEGGPSTEFYWRNLGQPGRALRPDAPMLATEYATKQRSFHEVEYPHPDSFGSWDEGLEFPYYSATNTVAFASRVFENTLALANAGVQKMVLWQLIDEPTEVLEKGKSWGAVDLWGLPKPVYSALSTLLPHVTVGARLLVPPEQTHNPLYAAGFRLADRFVVALSNDSGEAVRDTVTLVNAPSDLEIERAMAFRPVLRGDPALGEPDLAEVVEEGLVLRPEAPGEYSVDVNLPSDSTLTLVLDRAVGVTCEDIRILRARCGWSGEIQVTAWLANRDHHGDHLEITIDGVPFEMEIRGGLGRLRESASSGPHSILLTDPAECRPEQVLTCP